MSNYKYDHKTNEFKNLNVGFPNQDISIDFGTIDKNKIREMAETYQSLSPLERMKQPLMSMKRKVGERDKSGFSFLISKGKEHSPKSSIIASNVLTDVTIEYALFIASSNTS